MISKWYKPRNFAIPAGYPLRANVRQTLDVAPPPPDALFWKMWNDSIEIAEKVLATDYFKGILHNDLDPNAYGSLMVQDAYYCFEGRDDYAIAATHAYDDTLEEVMNAKAASYDEYNLYYHDTWHIKEAYGVIPDVPIHDYAAYERHIASHEETPYVLCVMLPCEYLWTWVANRLKPDADPAGLYYFWIEQNGGTPTGAYQMANLLERYRSVIDEEKASAVFIHAMMYEHLVFESATKLESEYYGKKRL